MYQKSKVASVLLAFLAVIALMQECKAQFVWVRNPPQLNGIAFGNGAYVAVGVQERVFHSEDGTAWEESPFYGQIARGSLRNLNAVVFGRERFVAVGDAGEIVTSIDGHTWKIQGSGVAVNLHAIAYGSGLGVFVAVGDNGTIITSEDGVTWRQETWVPPQNLYSVVFGNGTFVAVGDIGVILSSKSGHDWVLHRSMATAPLTSTAFGNFQFVTSDSQGNVLASPDGNNWSSPGVGPWQGAAVMSFLNGAFVAAPSSGSVYRSVDLTSWQLCNRSTGASFLGFAGGLTNSVAVGTSARVIASRDGAEWRSQVLGNFAFVADHPKGTWGGAFVTSTNESYFDFLSDDLSYYRVSSIYYGGLYGPYGWEGDSINSFGWAQDVRSYGLNDIACGNGVAVAVGFFRHFQGNATYRDDLPPLTVVSDRSYALVKNSQSGFSDDLYSLPTLQSITYGNGIFLAAGSSGVMVRSYDGSGWSSIASGVNASFSEVAYHDGFFWAKDSFGISYVSPALRPEFCFNQSSVSVPADAGTCTLSIQRTDTTGGSASVSYATKPVNGVEGTNYIAQTGTVTFAAGETSKQITIPILHDPVQQGELRFLVMLRDAKPVGRTAYPSAVVVRIANVNPPMSPYELWKASVFGDPNLPKAADAADPDGDGMSNLQEYAFGTDPLVPDRGNAGVSLALSQEPAGAYSLALAFRYRSSDLIRSYLIEESTNLNSWHASALFNVLPTQTATFTSAGMRSVRIVATELPEQVSEHFFRVRLNVTPSNRDTNTDWCGDGLTAGMKMRLGLNPFLIDTDGDGVPDALEDADRDGLPNLAEVRLGFDPLKSDTGNTGVPDGFKKGNNSGFGMAEEFVRGLDPSNWDSDSDGQDDPTEVAEGTNPLDPNSKSPTRVEALVSFLNSAPEVVASNTAVSAASGAASFLNSEPEALRSGMAVTVASPYNSYLNSTPDPLSSGAGITVSTPFSSYLNTSPEAVRSGAVIPAISQFTSYLNTTPEKIAPSVLVPVVSRASYLNSLPTALPAGSSLPLASPFVSYVNIAPDFVKAGSPVLVSSRFTSFLNSIPDSLEKGVGLSIASPFTSYLNSRAQALTTNIFKSYTPVVSYKNQ